METRTNNDSDLQKSLYYHVSCHCCKTNENLHSSRANKADEFYTMYSDIEVEMSLYKDCFKDKVIYCPCDDYRESNFSRFFVDNFEKLNMKKVITTGYNENEHGRICILSKDVMLLDKLNGDGDYRSDECRKYWDDSDIIVTNPPFSLSKEFMLDLIKSGKQFIVVGNVNAITYKGIFSEIVERRLFLGGTIHSGDRKFYIPDDYPLDGTSCGVDEYGKRFIRVKGVRWFTNIRYDVPPVKHTILKMKYSSDYYQKYDTYDAINVNSMKEIPIDWYEMMGVPITVLDKVNSEGYIEFKTERDEIVQFKLFGQLNGGNSPDNYDFAKPVINGKCKFKRLLIRRV